MKTNRTLFAALALCAIATHASALPIPVDHFLFNGDYADTGSAPLTMTKSGTVTFANSVPMRAAGQAAVFNGSGWLRADTGTVGNNVLGDFSVSFWMKTASSSLTGSQWWSGNGLVDAETNGTTSDWGISFLNNKVAFGIGGNDVTILSSSTVNDNQWHLVDATWSKTSGEMKLYLDGLLNSTGTASVGVSRTGQNRLAIGEISTGLNRYVGSLADIQIFNQVLTAQDVASVKAVPEPGSLALIGLGLAGLLARRKSKRA